MTERAVFELTPGGVVLREVAPGVELQRDVLHRMGFAPIMESSVGEIPSRHFAPPEPM